jgi:hypothetical protein
MRTLAAMTFALITTLLAHALDEQKLVDPTSGISAQTHQRPLWQRRADVIFVILPSLSSYE